MNSTDTSHREQLQELELAKARMELTEASFKAQTAQQQLGAAKMDMLTSQMLTLPHRSLPIKVYSDGIHWIAEYVCAEGDPVVGRGNCPQLALLDFDSQWAGTK